MRPDKQAQLVELLKCAASLETYEENAYGSFLRSAAIHLQAPPDVEEAARVACAFVCGDGTSRSIFLKAASREETKVS